MRGAQSRSSRLVFYVDMDFGTKDDVSFPYTTDGFCLNQPSNKQLQ